MSGLLGHASSHLVRRAAQDSNNDNLLEDTLRGWKLILQEIPAWGSLTLVFTILGFSVLMFAVEYTLSIVFRLAAIETRQQAFMIPSIESNTTPKPYRDSETAGDEGEGDEEVLLVQQKPITSKIRTTIHHLTSIGGGKARWRGLAYFLVLSICTMLLTPFFSWLSPFGAGIVARIIFAHWEMGWTHIVISNPSHEPWYRKIPPFKTWRKIWGPTALAAIAQQIGVFIPFVVGILFRLHKAVEKTDSSGVYIAKVLTVVVLLLICNCAIVIPVEVALTRVQASMLPEELQSIVPFDRTFGGRVVSEREGGKGKLSFADAWKTLDKEATARIIKLILKIFFIELAVFALYFLVLMVEFAVILVPAIGRAGDSPSDDMKLL